MPTKMLEELYKKLEEYSHFEKDEENFLKFSDIADEIILKKDPSSIPILLKYLNDECEYDYVQEHLSKALEHFGPKIYVTGLLINLENIIPKSKEMAESMFLGILNSKEHFEILKNHLTLGRQDLLKTLLDSMERSAQKYNNKVKQSLISELRKELEKSQHDNGDVS